MLRLIMLFAIIVCSFSACSDDSYADKVKGDNYSGTLNYFGATGTESVVDVFESVEVSELSGERIEIKLGGSLGSMIGVVDEFDNITVDQFEGVMSDGTELLFSDGDGSFSIEPLMGSEEADETKFINIFFIIDAVAIAQLALTEPIDN